MLIPGYWSIHLIRLCRVPSIGALRQSPSRLEALPAEVRNKIYRYLLYFRFSEVECPGTAEMDANKSNVNRFASRSYRFHTSILRVNKAISQETRSLFYKNNAFIAITTNRGRIVQQATYSFPIVMDGRLQSFPHFALCSTLTFALESYIQLKYDLTFLMVAHDLPTLIQQLRITLIREPGNLDLNVTLEICPRVFDFMDPARIERVALNPFKELVRVQNVDIRGTVSTSCAEETRAAMMCNPPLGSEILQEAGIIMEKANKCYRTGKMAQAEEYNSLGRELLLRPYTTNVRPDRTIHFGNQLVRQEIPNRLYLGDPSLLLEVAILISSFNLNLLRLAILFGRHQDAISKGISGEMFIDGHLPDYPSDLRAEWRYLRGLNHFHRGNTRYGLTEYGQTVNKMDELKQAEIHLLSALRLAPFSTKIQERLEMVYEKRQKLRLG